MSIRLYGQLYDKNKNKQIDTFHDNIVPIGEMKQGDIAKILRWTTNSHWQDNIIIKYNDGIISISSPKRWSNIFTDFADECNKNIIVRILQKGELLEVQ